MQKHNKGFVLTFLGLLLVACFAFSSCDDFKDAMEQGSIVVKNDSSSRSIVGIIISDDKNEMVASDLTTLSYPNSKTFSGLDEGYYTVLIEVVGPSAQYYRVTSVKGLNTTTVVWTGYSFY